MPPPNPANQLFDAPFADILLILLPQFKRLLGQRGISLTKTQMDALVGALVQKEELPENAESIQTALRQIVQESVDELQSRFGLDFAKSLSADMNQLGGWETTADFLEIANHKSNAELRISAGSSLLVALGDLDFADYLLTVIEVDDGVNDVDAAIAKRVLAHVSDIDLEQDDWSQAIKMWLKSKTET